MNFDSKYLIRWGIPGWVVMLAYLLTVAWIKQDIIWNGEFKVVESLGALISLGFIGIIFGYIMHQIYFSWNWLLSKQSKKINDQLIKLIADGEKKDQIKTGENAHDIYFNLEYEWHKQLLLLEESKRNYINDRYRYLLSTVHALGALLVAIAFCILGVILISIYFKYWDLAITILLILLSFLSWVIFSGFSYYSKNLINFQAKFFNSFFNNEFIESTTVYSYQEERIEN